METESDPQLTSAQITWRVYSLSIVSYVVAAAVIDPPLNPVLTLGILLVSIFLVALAMLFGR